MADGPAGMPPIPPVGLPQHASSTPSGPTGATGRETKRCTYSRRHKRGTRTCRYYQGHRLVKTCVKKPRHRQRCTHLAAPARDAPTARIAGTRTGSGFVSQTVPAVVKITWSTPGYVHSCSGAVVGPNLVLTAAHCVYSTAQDSQTPGSETPGYIGFYDPRTYVVIPGLNTGPNPRPYGTWTVRKLFVSAAYGNNPGDDWAVIEVNPNNGTNLANAVGWYYYVFPGRLVGYDYSGNPWPTHQLYSIGYPASGCFVNPTLSDPNCSSYYSGGNRQYWCGDVMAPNEVENPHQNPNYAATYGPNYALVINPCEMTGGASGGPVFGFNTTSNEWELVGVMNRGSHTSDGGLGVYLWSFWLPGRDSMFPDPYNFPALWDYVQNHL